MTVFKILTRTEGGVMELTVILNKSSNVPLYIQLYEYIKKEIITGRLEKDTKLPSIRGLSDYLKISKTTIEASYQQLFAEGYLKSAPKVGYYVNVIDNNLAQLEQKGSNSWEESLITEPLVPSEYDFRNDSIDKESFDFLIWKRYINKAIHEYADRFLTYGSFQGEYELRKEIAKYVHQSRGVVCTPEQIIIGGGVQSLLNILCGMLKPDFQSIGFEDPGFKQARHIFRDHSMDIIPINLEQDGINVKELAKSKTRLVYVSPSHQFPMGSIMSINKRLQLLKWAQKNLGLIIEDDYDSELRYFGRPIPSLQGLSEGGSVVYLGSFSKILLPSIRISFMVLPQSLLDNYSEKMSKYNQTSSKIEQMALSLFMKEGQLEKQIRKLRKIYAKKNQLLLESISKIMGENVNVFGHDTGLHVLLELKTTKSPQVITNLAEKVGIKVTPIKNYYINSQEKQFPLVLLSYGGIASEEIWVAIEILNKVWFKKKCSC